MEPRDIALEVARLADDKHADRIEIIDISKLSSVADYLVICSAASERQVQAVTDNIEKGLSDAGVRPIGTEGVEAGRWALLDYFDVVAHIFHSPVRDFYDIEGLWADAPRLDAGSVLSANRTGAKGAAESGEEAG